VNACIEGSPMIARLSFAAMLSAIALAGTTSVQSAELQQVKNFGANPGNLKMYVYAPESAGRGAALVVVGRGCIQTVEEQMEHSGWPQIAERYGFVLVFPDTSKENEPFANCFRTWLPAHQARGAGEPLSVREMVRWSIRNLHVDRKRVFIAGVSSGGMLANVMLAAYPDVFAAGAVAAGTPYRCSNRFEDVAPCATGSVTRSRNAWARFVRGAYPRFRGPRPRVSIWHGEADTIISPRNAEQEILQWTAVLNTDGIPMESSKMQGYTRQVFAGRDGKPRVEVLLIQGMGHAWPVKPGNGAEDCGKAGRFFEAGPLCAALWTARWFGIAN
jgi:poly(hydroxyalkanoate) depolymerase family esterase